MQIPHSPLSLSEHLKTCVTEHRQQRLASEEKIKLEFRVVTPEVRGGSQEELRVPESSYTRLLVGWRPRGATPPPRSRGCMGTRGPGRATPCSRSGGAAVRRYPSSKVRSRGCALLE